MGSNILFPIILGLLGRISKWEEGTGKEILRKKKLGYGRISSRSELYTALPTSWSNSSARCVASSPSSSWMRAPRAWAVDSRTGATTYRVIVYKYVAEFTVQVYSAKL